MTGRTASATERALRLVAKGVSIRDAAQRCGVSPRTISYARKRLGLPPLPVGRKAKNPHEAG